MEPVLIVCVSSGGACMWFPVSSSAAATILAVLALFRVWGCFLVLLAATDGGGGHRGVT